MCTIITANNEVDRFKLIERIKCDAIGNPDGFSMLMVLDNAKPLVLRTMDAEPIVQLIMAMDYNRVFIHTRFATQGESTLGNTHGWNHNGTYVFHNGSISSPVAGNYEVDSQAIVHWLSWEGLDTTLDRLISEPFANVFLVNVDDGNYIVHRSRGGSLYTDGLGNYSTNEFDHVTIPVPQYTLEQFDLDVDNAPDNPWSSYDPLDDLTNEHSVLDDYYYPRRTGT